MHLIKVHHIVFTVSIHKQMNIQEIATTQYHNHLVRVYMSTLPFFVSTNTEWQFGKIRSIGRRKWNIKTIKNRTSHIRSMSAVVITTPIFLVTISPCEAIWSCTRFWEQTGMPSAITVFCVRCVYLPWGD